MKAALVKEPLQVAAGDMRHKLQPGAPQGQEGWAGQAGVGICGPRPSTAPMLTSQCSCCPSPQGFSHTPPPAFPLPAQPQAACSPGSHRRLWAKEEPRREGEGSLPLQK